MKTVILSHVVRDYAEWRKAYDSDEKNRAASGMVITGVYRASENPNHITVIGEIASAEAIKAFMSNPDLKAAMERGGVISVPEVKILDKA
jgi:hypothetical protein